MSALLTCLSCGTRRPEHEMEQAWTFTRHPIPDGWQCRDGEACFRAVLAGVGGRG